MATCRKCDKEINEKTKKKRNELCPKCLKLDLSWVQTAKRLYS